MCASTNFPLARSLSFSADLLNLICPWSPLATLTQLCHKPNWSIAIANHHEQ